MCAQSAEKRARIVVTSRTKSARITSGADIVLFLLEPLDNWFDVCSYTYLTGYSAAALAGTETVSVPTGTTESRCRSDTRCRSLPSLNRTGEEERSAQSHAINLNCATETGPGGGGVEELGGGGGRGGMRRQGT